MVYLYFALKQFYKEKYGQRIIKDRWKEKEKSSQNIGAMKTTRGKGRKFISNVTITELRDLGKFTRSDAQMW